ncbi:pyridoxal-phosphate dependent enzyme [Stenotrophobium rhamnosiphilum]|uniref:pyridoxal-phosphate dependent enzyme n=1 Tax=Stenotrophobium rhamnosiphilum TaxID=2029166 RepID=UPI001374D2EE|nr:pyridoxal-phosphate dependent enzyme [Stenotrophobium rhamnosiphilum]
MGSPLHVLIPITGAGEESLSAAVARIAPENIYARNSIERPMLLGRTRVEVVKRDGNSFIEITSRESVREPILDLIIELISIDGSKLQRSYSLLLDPPDSRAPVQTTASTKLQTVQQQSPAVQMKPLAVAEAPQPVLQTPTPAKAPVKQQRRIAPVAQPQKLAPPVLDTSEPITLEHPRLKLSERLEHPPFIRASEPANIKRDTTPQLLTTYGVNAETTTTLAVAEDVAPAAGVESNPEQTAAIDKKPATSGISNIWIAFVALLVAVAGFKFWQKRSTSTRPSSPAAASVRVEQDEVIPATPSQNINSAPAPIPNEIPEHWQDPIPLVEAAPSYSPPPREIVEVAKAPLEQHPEHALSFYHDVAQLLKASLTQEPKRRDLRYKLLEIFYAANLKEEFREQTRFYLEQLEGRSDENWAEIVRMGRQLLPDSNLFSDTPQVLTRTTVQVLPVMQTPKKPEFERFYESVNQSELSARQAELEQDWERITQSASFEQMFRELMQQNMPRPTPLQKIERVASDENGAQIFRKFEDQRGATDIPLINACGQVLLGQCLGKNRIITATQDGIHGVAVATVARLLRMKCTIYMPQATQEQNAARLRRMRELGADIITLYPSMDASHEDIRSRALEDWFLDSKGSFYVNSIDAGPYPYPSIVQYFQGIVGRETQEQMHELGILPDAIIAGTGDGFSAIGLLGPYLNDKQVSLYCVETTVPSSQQKIRHRFGREHSWMRTSGRVSYLTTSIADATQTIADAEKQYGWSLDLPAAEVLAQAKVLARKMRPDQKLLVMLPKPEDSQIVPTAWHVTTKGPIDLALKQ